MMQVLRLLAVSQQQMRALRFEFYPGSTGGVEITLRAVINGTDCQQRVNIAEGCEPLELFRAVDTAIDGMQLAALRSVHPDDWRMLLEERRKVRRGIARAIADDTLVEVA